MGNFKGKRILITGGTSGVGLMTARLLRQKGAEVWITGRTEGTDGFPFIRLDQAKLDSSAVDALLSPYFFDMALLNAGVFFPPDGGTYETNLFGTCKVLSSIVRLNPRARIVIVTSLNRKMPRAKRLEDVLLTDNPRKAYAYSKGLLCVLATDYLIRGFDVRLAHPGVVKTKILAKAPPWKRWQNALLTKGHDIEEAVNVMAFALSDEANPGDFVVPSSFFETKGQPKRKKFPRVNRELESELEQVIGLTAV